MHSSRICHIQTKVAVILPSNSTYNNCATTATTAIVIIAPVVVCADALFPWIPFTNPLIIFPKLSKVPDAPVLDVRPEIPVVVDGVVDLAVPVEVEFEVEFEVGIGVGIGLGDEIGVDDPSLVADSVLSPVVVDSVGVGGIWLFAPVAVADVDVDVDDCEHVESINCLT